MNYWHVENCNLSECHIPLFELLKKVQKNGRYTAREMYGCRRLVAHHNTDIHGDTAPQDTWYPGTYWVMGAAWLCTHLWMHYLYTKNLVFLRNAFPVIAEAALFFVDYLEEKDGYLELSMSWKDGRITAAVFTAYSDVDTVVKYKETEKRLRLKEGEIKDIMQY